MSERCSHWFSAIVGKEERGRDDGVSLVGDVFENNECGRITTGKGGEGEEEGKKNGTSEKNADENE